MSERLTPEEKAVIAAAEKVRDIRKLPDITNREVYCLARLELDAAVDALRASRKRWKVGDSPGCLFLHGGSSSVSCYTNGAPDSALSAHIAALLNHADEQERGR